MKVSIITACKNAELTIEDTIRSITKQTYSNIEHIIIDGISEDNTRELVKKYPDTVTKFISEPDTGVYDAMNKGIKHSTGDILLFLNADDVLINENVIEIVAKEFKSNKSEILLGNIIFLDKYTGAIYAMKQDFVDKIKLISSTIFHPATFFRREAFEKYGYYNEENKITSDYEWYLNYFIKNNGKFKYIDTPISIFSIGGLSSSEKYSKIHDEERKLIQEKFFSKSELKTIKILLKLFPRKINKLKFRKKLEKFGLNKFW